MKKFFPSRFFYDTLFEFFFESPFFHKGGKNNQGEKISNWNKRIYLDFIQKS